MLRSDRVSHPRRVIPKLLGSPMGGWGQCLSVFWTSKGETWTKYSVGVFLYNHASSVSWILKNIIHESITSAPLQILVGGSSRSSFVWRKEIADAFSKWFRKVQEFTHIDTWQIINCQRSRVSHAGTWVMVHRPLDILKQCCGPCRERRGGKVHR